MFDSAFGVVAGVTLSTVLSCLFGAAAGVIGVEGLTSADLLFFALFWGCCGMPNASCSLRIYSSCVISACSRGDDSVLPLILDFEAAEYNTPHIINISQKTPIAANLFV